jgi:hypothetical protein
MSPRRLRPLAGQLNAMRIPSETWEHLRKEAKKQDRSISYLVRDILRQEMERQRLKLRRASKKEASKT